jgi:hypothetical protein
MLILAAEAFVRSLVAPHVAADAAEYLDQITCAPFPELAHAMIGGGASPDLTEVKCTVPTLCGTDLILPFFHDPARGLFSTAPHFWWTLGHECPAMLTDAALAQFNAALPDGGPIDEGPVYAN